jgi:hypothetical protein
MGSKRVSTQEDTMKGSEKQIQWAQSKIDSAKAMNDRRLADEQACYDADIAEYGEGNDSRLYCRRCLHGIIEMGLRSLSDNGNASQVIDFGIDTRKMVIDNQAELLPYKGWIETTFPTMQDFLRWAAL